MFQRQQHTEQLALILLTSKGTIGLNNITLGEAQADDQWVVRVGLKGSYAAEDVDEGLRAGTGHRSFLGIFVLLVTFVSYLIWSRYGWQTLIVHICVCGSWTQVICTHKGTSDLNSSIDILTLASSTSSSLAICHPTSFLAQCCLTSVLKWEPVIPIGHWLS